jgi:hypothetical protein
MGNLTSSFADAMIEKQKQAQLELQEVMMAKQWKNNVRAQERMRRQMVAQQMAMARERVWWFGGFAGTMLLGFCGFAVKHKRVPPAAVAPLLALLTVTAYQVDLAYGNKLDRVNRMMNEIVDSGKYWFTPLTPPDEQQKK